MTELTCWPLDNKPYTSVALGAAYAARSRGVLNADSFTATTNGDNTITVGKAGMLVVVIVAALTDAVLSIAVANLPGLGITYQSLILPVVLVWYIFTELGSIAENAAHMGADVPDGLLKLLAAGKKAAERQTKDDEE